MKRTCDEVADNSKKKAKVHQNLQRYRKDYTEEWPCLIKSSLSNNHIFCTLCSCDFSIIHGGRDDCRRHVNCKKHAAFAKSRDENKNIANFFCVKKDDNAVINAELLFSRFLIEHNIALQASDHAGMLFRKMFPDSEIAKKYGSARTKTTAIVRCVAEDVKKNIVNILQNSFYSLSTDASNDVNDKKLYPLVITFHNESDGKINPTLLSLEESSDSTGEGIFNVLNDAFIRNNVKWENCISFACDNANNMIGKYKGLAAFITKQYPHVKIIGCSCHLIHRAVSKATKEALPLDIEMLVIQIFYYLQKSSKRKHQFSVYQKLCGEKLHKIVKHVNTRWLSLENSLSRVVEQWEPLKQFFNSDEGSSNGGNSSYETIKRMLQSPVTKLYALFLRTVMNVFNKVNLALQQEKPCIHILKRELQSLFFDLIVRFVKPIAVSKAESVLSLKYQKKKNQKEDEDLVIGSATRTFLNENNFTEETKDKFFCSVRKFFCIACEYIQKKFPLEDEFLKHTEVADIKDRCSTSFKSIKYFVDRFPNLLKGSIDENIDILEIEFANFQAQNFSPDIMDCDRIDVAWHRIAMLTHLDGTRKYKILPKLMQAILTVPHSNAATERIFSMVRKNQTEFRSSLGVKTLEALLIEKLDIDKCYDKTFTKEELRKAKSATYVQNTNSDNMEKI